MAKIKTMYVCNNCGEEALSWQGKCPVCGEWNTFKEIKVDTRGATMSASSVALESVKPLNLAEYDEQTSRTSSGISEFDRVLGGGFVPGSVILLGGEPGIGKSTLLLQVAENLASSGVMYFSGEESAHQVAGRAKRLGISPHFGFANETRVDVIKQHILQQKPGLVIIDSIQTLYDDSFPSTPGSLVQVRECALRLQELAKAQGVSLILVGHITKEGTVAGPKTLEHMVDVVLYLEGESRSETRILRSMKNRFGATHEVGLFALEEQGMKPVENPSALFVDEHREAVPGTALTVVLEGSRPILVEVQALVVPTPFGYPKRTASGIDLQRIHILLAILESRTPFSFASSDVFINIVGGYKIAERGADLAVCMALMSAATSSTLPERQLFYGEVGLTGEVRSVPQAKRRKDEMDRLGYIAPPTHRTIAQFAQEFGLGTGSKRRGRPHAHSESE